MTMITYYYIVGSLSSLSLLFSPKLWKCLHEKNKKRRKSVRHFYFSTHINYNAQPYTAFCNNNNEPKKQKKYIHSPIERERESREKETHSHKWPIISNANLSFIHISTVNGYECISAHSEIVSQICVCCWCRMSIFFILCVYVLKRVTKKLFVCTKLLRKLFNLKLHFTTISFEPSKRSDVYMCVCVWMAISPHIFHGQLDAIMKNGISVYSRNLVLRYNIFAWSVQYALY